MKLFGALLYTYAHRTRKLDLKAIASKKAWQIREMRDEERLRHAMAVQAEVDLHLHEFTRYGAVQ